jgi:hypothetical protein
MTWIRWRRAAGLYLCLFFLAVAAAPHQHLNGLEDLLLDQRSDSGVLVQASGPPGTADAPALDASTVVRDIPCLACFTRDFVAAPQASFLLAASLTRLPLVPAPPLSATPELAPADTPSRAPPGIS